MLVGLDSQEATYKEIVSVVRGNMQRYAPSSITRVHL
jgi:hypothetical protein